MAPKRKHGPGDYLCHKCLRPSDRVVAHFPSQTGGPCARCAQHIAEGDATYKIDNGKRAGRTRVPDPTLFDLTKWGPR